MIKNTLISLFLLVFLSTNSYSAGTSSSSDSNSSDYSKAVKFVKAAKKLNMRIACEIFADRNYEDDGNLVSRKKSNALITDPLEAQKHVLNMVKNQSLNCHSGKQIPCEIDSVCIHGDNESSLATAKSIKNNLIENGLTLKPLTQMEKFIK